MYQQISTEDLKMGFCIYFIRHNIHFGSLNLIINFLFFLQQ